MLRYALIAAACRLLLPAFMPLLIRHYAAIVDVSRYARVTCHVECTNARRTDIATEC